MLVEVGWKRTNGIDCKIYEPFPHNHTSPLNSANWLILTNCVITQTKSITEKQTGMWLILYIFLIVILIFLSLKLIWFLWKKFALNSLMTESLLYVMKTSLQVLKRENEMIPDIKVYIMIYCSFMYFISRIFECWKLWAIYFTENIPLHK